MKNKVEEDESDENTNVNEEAENDKYFENTIFMGDSITEGLSELGVISEYNVIGINGDNVLKAKDHIPKLIICLVSPLPVMDKAINIKNSQTGIW